MPLNESKIVWKADPHTIAKIKILEAYLMAWFQILGRTRAGQELVYIDGFAGPGEYTNSPNGSPMAALSSASIALSRTKTDWKAGDIYCIFIEESASRFAHLMNRLGNSEVPEKIKITPYNETFVAGLRKVRQELPFLFNKRCPLFAFIDPCGATGVPLSDVVGLLKNRSTEVLLNFDADGIGRIYKAGKGANHESLLNEIYSDESWRDRFKTTSSFDSLCREALELYREKLLSIGGVKYVFPFEMRTKANTINYFLLFASQHPLGLEKMKEAMKRVDQSGEYCFSDARIGQESLFRFDSPSQYAKQMLHHFEGKTVSYSDIRDFALLQTPFINPKAMLKELTENDDIHVLSVGRRTKGTFNETRIISIRFKE